MQNFLKSLIIILMVISMNFVMIGCNTMEGLGKDVESAGDKIQDNAD